MTFPPDFENPSIKMVRSSESTQPNKLLLSFSQTSWKTRMHFAQLPVRSEGDLAVPFTLKPGSTYLLTAGPHSVL
jgi:hypothetical protein